MAIEDYELETKIIYDLDDCGEKIQEVLRHLRNFPDDKIILENDKDTFRGKLQRIKYLCLSLNSEINNALMK